jgi:hypothetical protein
MASSTLKKILGKPRKNLPAPHCGHLVNENRRPGRATSVGFFSLFHGVKWARGRRGFFEPHPPASLTRRPASPAGQPHPPASLTRRPASPGGHRHQPADLTRRPTSPAGRPHPPASLTRRPTSPAGQPHPPADLTRPYTFWEIPYRGGSAGRGADGGAPYTLCEILLGRGGEQLCTFCISDRPSLGTPACGGTGNSLAVGDLEKNRLTSQPTWVAFLCG